MNSVPLIVDLIVISGLYVRGSGRRQIESCAEVRCVSHAGVDPTAAKSVFQGEVKDVSKDPINQMDRSPAQSSWTLTPRLNRARHAHLISMPIDSQLAEKWGLVSQVLPPAELMKTANAIAETILKNNENMVLNIKAVVNDGANMPLGEALRQEKYIAGRRQAPSKLQFRLIHSRFICSIVVVVGYKLDC
ncbi:hypothetical protein R1flu_001054 [Riccia fluitans]|uniref:Uncharacterized protein n=1 Tax=Riccia fluitans TaxID=41844 RepID=A0ABD1Y259_9MARC